MGPLETCILVASCVCIVSLVTLSVSLWTARRGRRVKKLGQGDAEKAASVTSSVEVPLLPAAAAFKIAEFVDTNMSSSGSGEWR